MFNTYNHCRLVLAAQFFVLPADHNYQIARWAMIHGFYQEFFWQASQAIEKYLKSTLALNDFQVQKHGHNIVRLYADHKNIFAGVRLEKFSKPKKLNKEFWQDESIDDFILRIGRFGDPNSRYGMTSWVIMRGDLFKFDQIIFDIRRLSIGLGWIIGQDWKIKNKISKFRGQTYREFFTSDRFHQVHSKIKSTNIANNISGENISDTLYAWNFAFLRSKIDNEKPAPTTITSRLGPLKNSYMYLIWRQLELEESGKDIILVDGVRWLLDHVPLEKQTKIAFANRIREIDSRDI